MTEEAYTPVRRASALYAVILILGILILGRLFYLQVIRYDFYVAEALAEHESKFSIPAARGTIFALDGSLETPLVLNEVLPTVYLDPLGIDDEDNDEIAGQLAGVLSIEKSFVLGLLDQNESRYQVVKKQLTREEVAAVEELSINGVGMTDESYRVYPQGPLAAQSLGFVNGEGAGQYGIESFLDDDLNGQNGRFEAVTDAFGIPLATAEEQVIEPAKDGTDITLTLDVNVQKQVETLLEKGVTDSGAQTGSAIVMDPNTGAIVAMASFPSFNPTDFTDVEDFSRFTNHVVSSPYETGSGVKVLTMAAALNEGVVSPDTSYYDAGYVQVDDRRIENAGSGGGINRTMTDVIRRSVNTGMVYALQQLGGGEINDQAREKLYDYFTNSYGFGLPTGIAQDNEAGGIIIGPNEEQGNNVRYANMTFGQGMTVTMLQMAAAVSSVVNGGDYFQPYLVHSTTDSGEKSFNQPQIVREGVVSEGVSSSIVRMMEEVVLAGGGQSARRDGYTVGGKTGTAQVLEDDGTYSGTREIGSFVGYTGGSEVEYVIMTRVDEPTIAGYAGSVAAAPIFADISNYLIDYYQIPPK